MTQFIDTLVGIFQPTAERFLSLSENLRVFRQKACSLLRA